MGVMITNLQRETKATSIRAMQRVGDSLWTAVVIIGEWKSIVAAYKAVSDLVYGGREFVCCISVRIEGLKQ
ncbi:hypothetical protein EON65_47650 [archaeon]|nr:MAG: hypothetical protein EON65_47650 [archaeon]